MIMERANNKVLYNRVKQMPFNLNHFNSCVSLCCSPVIHSCDYFLLMKFSYIALCQNIDHLSFFHVSVKGYVMVIDFDVTKTKK